MGLGREDKCQFVKTKVDTSTVVQGRFIEVREQKQKQRSRVKQFE
jgi:hypothetical protein